MATKQELVQVRIYKKDYGVLRRLALRKSLGKPKNVSIAEIINWLIKGI